MKHLILSLLLAAACFTWPAMAQQQPESRTDDVQSRLVLGIKTDNTGQYLLNVNEAWMQVDPKAFSAEDENGLKVGIQSLRPPFMAKLRYRATGDANNTHTVIEVKVIEQYAYNSDGYVVRPGHTAPIGQEDQETYFKNLREKERAR